MRWQNTYLNENQSFRIPLLRRIGQINGVVFTIDLVGLSSPNDHNIGRIITIEWIRRRHPSGRYQAISVGIPAWREQEIQAAGEAPSSQHRALRDVSDSAFCTKVGTPNG